MVRRTVIVLVEDTPTLRKLNPVPEFMRVFLRLRYDFATGHLSLLFGNHRALRTT